MGSIHHFLLVPDRAAARKVRRAVAGDRPRLGLQVGTWIELLQAARNAYLLQESEDLFSEKLAAAASKLNKAFWAKSHQVAPTETEAVLARELSRLLLGLGPGRAIPSKPSEGLSTRASQHLEDMAALHQAMDYVLPPDLEDVQAILAFDASQAIRVLLVCHVEGLPDLNHWQRALIDKLNGAVAGERDDEFAILLEKTLLPQPAAKPRTALYSLQTDLFQPNATKVKQDNTVQWVGCRDYLEEVEICAGMIQQAMRDDKTLAYEDFALLLAEDTAYPPSVEAVFAKAGLPLSGLVVTTRSRDLGAEVVRFFLLSMRKPAPVMALAAFVTNPLLSWGEEKGREMADRIMGGHLKFPLPKGRNPQTRDFTNYLNTGTKYQPELAEALGLLAQHIQPPASLESHQINALKSINQAISILQGKGDIPWNRLLQNVQPGSISASRSGELTREGIAVMQEGGEPWRAVRSLFVLGFQDGHYPQNAGSSPVFFEEDLEALNTLELELATPTQLLTRARERFQRQLQIASEQLIFLLPRRNGLGEPLAPSSSLVYMAQLIEGAKAEEMVWDLDSTEDRAKVQGLALATEAQPTPPRALLLEDLNLNCNLLEAGENGWPAAHQSPSSLDTLMVSPLAWVLSRYGIEPKSWAPQELGPALQGSLAHRVFERLFPMNKPLIAGNKVEAAAAKELGRVIAEEAPFLQAPEWRVERFNLSAQVGMAALRWRYFLATSKAKVVGLEIHLRGKLDDLQLKGFADSLLQMPGGRLFVVDFKKSSSGTRRKRMDKGYDSQANLYRIMLKSGGKDLSKELQKLLKSKPEIGIMYFLMNDQMVLTDTDGWLGGGIENVEEMGVDVAVNAMVDIRAQLAAVRKGKISLNHAEDAKTFDRNGVGTYALDASPLVPLFTVPASEEG